MIQQMPPDQGPELTGMWINTKNGKVINIANTVIEGDQMIVITDEGTQIDGMTFSQNYLQVDPSNDDVDQLVRSFAGGIDMSLSNPVHVSNDMLQLDPSENISASGTSKRPTRTTHDKSVRQDVSILEKIFTKEPPTVRVDTKSFSIPEEPLKMACQFLDVTVDQIVDYILNNITLDKQALEEMVRKRLS